MYCPKSNKKRGKLKYTWDLFKISGLERKKMERIVFAVKNTLALFVVPKSLFTISDISLKLPQKRKCINVNSYNTNIPYVTKKSFFKDTQKQSVLDNHYQSAASSSLQ